VKAWYGMVGRRFHDVDRLIGIVETVIASSLELID
jgi:hypothetical protein